MKYWLKKLMSISNSLSSTNRSVGPNLKLDQHDISLLNTVSNSTSVPVIACGGVGNWEHLYEGLSKTNVDAVAAANIFHFVDQSVYLSKKFLYDKKLNVRKPDLLEIN